MTWILVVIAVVVLLPGAVTAIHLGVLALASLFYREKAVGPREGAIAFLALVPAHNEEKLIGRTLDTLKTEIGPRDQILVVADRCTDGTAEIARQAGANVLVREAGATPGRAAARDDGLRHALDMEWDAIVMIDADTIVEPGFFAACEAALASGAEAAQARLASIRGPRVLDQVAVASCALQGVMIPRGRARLGLHVRLIGWGMVLSRRLATSTTARFRAAASEDLWYSLELHLEGIRPRYMDQARLRSESVGSWRAAGTQRTRYEAGRMSAAREFALPLLRRGDLASLEAAGFLLTPPFAVAALCLLLGTGFAALADAPVLVWSGVGLLALMVLSLAVTLLEARAPARTWLALAIAPWYLPWKAVVQLRAFLRLRRGDAVYEPTPRS
jgi:1,2-diacylglycerol 3-beta-glucosyltransferase